MAAFKATGDSTFKDFDRDRSRRPGADDAEIRAIIRRVHRTYGYIVDPHTACGFQDLAPRPARRAWRRPPGEIPDMIREAIGIEPTQPCLEALKSRPVAKHKIVADAAAIRGFIEARALSTGPPMPQDATRIYDTALRDGTQGEGIGFSVADKLLIVERLDQLVSFIEGGVARGRIRGTSLSSPRRRT